MSEIIEKNKHYLVKSEYGSYSFNNRKTAENLNKTLNNYETIAKQHKDTEATLDRIQKQVIQLQMTCSILTDELRKLHEEII